MPATVLPLERNEVLIVARSDRRVSCWTAWRRHIAAFNDPRLWEGLEHWPQYFERQPDSAGWGLEGYGVVVMDMDRRHCWSINDYSDPTELHLPNETDANPAQRAENQALLQLLARPSWWPLVKLHLIDTQDNPNLASTQVLLSDFLPPGIAPLDAFARLTIEAGLLQWQGRDFRAGGGEILPPGWLVYTSANTTPGRVLPWFLQDMRMAGFAPPDWGNIRSRLAHFFPNGVHEEAGSAHQLIDALEANWDRPDVPLDVALALPADVFPVD